MKSSFRSVWMAAFGALAISVAPSVARADCRNIERGGVSYTVCDFDARRSRIELFLRDGDGAILGGFDRLQDDLKKRGETLIFAMNAGMYGEDRAPVGLFIERGETSRGVNLSGGSGNFHMRPNGVFWVDGARAGVMESHAFRAKRLHPAFATQSGPMLLSAGRLNPNIHEDGQSEKIRNGVCVTQGRLVHFAISNSPVSFHAFAHLFGDELHCRDALYLDGSISSLYSRELARDDRFRPMGPMIGVVEKAKR